MEPIELDGLSLYDLRELLLEYLTARKKGMHQQQLVQQDLELWQHRKILASQDNNERLQAIAVQHCSELQLQLNRLQTELPESEAAITQLRRSLQNRPEIEPSAAESLLAQLSQLLGPHVELERELRSLEQDDQIASDIERLRREIDADAESENDP